MSALRQALKYCVPFGLVAGARNRRTLREAGRAARWSDWWKGEWLVHEAAASGLDLLPTGAWRELRVVVDVGANVGQWSGMLLDLITPDRLIVIEPQPSAFAELQRNLGSRSNVELHPTAVGETEGVTHFRITRDTTGASVLLPAEEMRELIGSNWTVESEIEVPITTLDNLLAEVPEISLLKIDVQGFEREVITGATQALARTDFLLVELNYQRQYIGGSWLGEIHEQLTGSGGFTLVDTSKPLRLNGRASMCDGLYVNTARRPDFAPREFV